MKRTIAIFAFFLAFSLNANAQQAKTLSANNNASNEKNQKIVIIDQVEKISKIVSIDESLKNDLTTILFMRNEAIENSKTAEEKKAVFERFTTKLLGAFNEEQIQVLKKDKDFFTNLTQYSSK